MNIYKDLEEIETAQEKLSSLMDNVLDLYKKFPKDCSNILKECQSLKEEYSELYKNFTEIQKEL